MKSKNTKCFRILVILLVFNILYPMALIPTIHLNSDNIANGTYQIMQDVGHFNIRVRDSVTGAKLPNCLIEITNASGYKVYTNYTDKNGNLGTPTFLYGTYNITASMPGYVSQMLIRVLDKAVKSTWFYLVASVVDNIGYIEVHVNNTTAAIEGATLQLYKNFVLIGSNTTDASGISNFTKLGSGVYNVTISKTGYLTQTKGAVLDFNGDSEILYFTLEPEPVNPGQIHVTVLEALDNSPISDANVVVRNASSNVIVSNGFTTTNGIFIAAGLNGGWYNVTVKKNGYYSQKQDVQVTAGQTSFLLFYLTQYGPNTAWIEVTVLNETFTNETQPISGAYVAAIYRDSAVTLTDGLTDNQGVFNATNLPTGWVDIEVSKSGYYPVTVAKRIDYNGEGTHLIIYLIKVELSLINLVVYVKDVDTGQSVLNAQVNVSQYGTTIAKSSTLANGYVNVTGIDNTTCTITTSRAGYITKITILDLSNYNASDTAEVTIYLKQYGYSTGVIEVYVKDKGTRNPLANASVTITFPNGTTFLGETDENGFLNIKNLTKGVYTVNVTKANYRSQELTTEIEVNGDVDTLEFLLIRLEYPTIPLILQPITPNPDPTGDIDLVWNDLPFTKVYMVYRGESPGALTHVMNVSGDTTTYRDIGVPGLLVYYQIVATNGTHFAVSNIEWVTIYREGAKLHPGWILVCILATIAGILAMYIMVIDEMRRDEEKLLKGIIKGKKTK